MLVNMREMLNKAKDEKYAVGQFNINNLEWTIAVLKKAQELNSPVILGVSQGAAKYMCGFNVVSAMVKELIKSLNITYDAEGFRAAQQRRQVRRAAERGFQCPPWGAPGGWPVGS